MHSTVVMRNVTSLVVQTVKHLPTMQETCVQSLAQGDLLEKGMATHSSILAPTHQKGGLNLYHQFSSVQLLSRVQLFATP